MDNELNLIEDQSDATVIEATKPDRGDVVTTGKPVDSSAEESTSLPPEAPIEAPAVTGKKQGSDHVPISRFNEVNKEKKELAARLEAAEAENARLRTPAQVPTATQAEELPIFDEDAQEAAFIEALMEGDAAKASGIRKAINAHIREQSVATATEAVRGEASAREAAGALGRASQQAVADFPYLDTEDGAEAVEMIVAMRDRRVSQGVPIAEALRLAVAAIAPKFAPVTGHDDDTKETHKDTRTANALARGAADSVAQPPAVQAGIGNRAAVSKVVASELTDEQFDQLTPAEKKRLRGD